MNFKETGARPYISKSGLKSYLEGQGYSEAQIRKAVDPSNSDGMVGGLLLANIIKPFEHGWIIIDDALATAMMIRKNEGVQ